MVAPDSNDSEATTLRHLLYRYWFWGWLFRDAGCGDPLARAAALRENAARRLHLVVYARRWTALTALLAAAGHALERATLPAAITASFFVGASLAVVVAVVAAASFALLASYARVDTRPRLRKAATRIRLP